MISIIRDAIGNTGQSERIFYVLVVIAGAILAILGWRLDVSRWTTTHPYLVGLLDGVTTSCFAVPVAGIVIGEITRRATQSAERRAAARTTLAQLDYIDRLAAELSPGPVQATSERLRDLADVARDAAPKASAIAKEASAGTLFVKVGALAILPQVDKKSALELRRAVQDDRSWASVSFICGQLANGISRLLAVLDPPGPTQTTFPDWLDQLIASVQILREVRLHANWRWLSEGVKDPPAAVRISAWSWTDLEPPKKSPLLVSIQQAAQPSDTAERKRLLTAAQDRATDELRRELTELAYHLDSLAGLVDAATACRSELNSLEER